MRRALSALVLVAALMPVRAGPAQGGTSFDYWLLAVTWMPAWCALEGESRRDGRCEAPQGWALHGLWPQFETGWPEFCRSAHRDPDRRKTAEQATLYGSSGLAWHQWRKHGRCADMAPEVYFATTAAAYAALTLPVPATAGARPVPIRDLLAEMRAANPAIPEDGLVAICRRGHLYEVRICLDTERVPRPCGADVLARGCTGRAILAPPD